MATQYESGSSRPSFSRCRTALVSGLLACFSQAALAFSFGDLVVESYLGESFLAHVNITLAPGEVIDESCFKLVPAKTAEGVSVLLPNPKLKFMPLPNKGTLTIETLQSINEPAVQFIVEVSCSGVGQLQREYVVLLDPAVLSVPLVSAIALNSSSKIVARAGRGTSSKTKGGKKNSSGNSAAGANKSNELRAKKTKQKRTRPVVATNSNAINAPSDTPLPDETGPTTDLLPKVQDTPLPVAATSPKPFAQQKDQSKNKPRANKAQKSGRNDFLLKLSSAEIDLSHSEKMTEKERAEIREQQLLMDGDDYVANLLASKNKLKELEGRIADLQTKVGTGVAPNAAPYTASPTGAAPAAIQSPNPEPAPPIQSAPPPPLDATPQPGAAPVSAAASINAQPRIPMPGVTKHAAPESMLSWISKHWYVGIVLLLVAGLIIRTLRRRREQAAEEMRYQYEYHEPSINPVTQPQPQPQPVEQPMQAEELEMLEIPGATEPAAANPKDLYRNVIINQFPELKSAGNTEARTVINVAWQYFEDRGERSRAIELIEFGLEEHPDVDELWLTQFEFLLRDKRRSAYEQLAKRYRQRFPSDQSWIKIQSWIQIQSGGRYLDPDNPLYAVEAIADNEAKVMSLDFANTGTGQQEDEKSAVADNAVINFSIPPKN